MDVNGITIVFLFHPRTECIHFSFATKRSSTSPSEISSTIWAADPAAVPPSAFGRELFAQNNLGSCSGWSPQAQQTCHETHRTFATCAFHQKTVKFGWLMLQSWKTYRSFASDGRLPSLRFQRLRPVGSIHRSLLHRGAFGATSP